MKKLTLRTKREIKNFLKSKKFKEEMEKIEREKENFLKNMEIDPKKMNIPFDI
jgi:hypothetical protein